MNTNMVGYGFQKIFASLYLHPCVLDESSLSIGRIKSLGSMLLKKMNEEYT